MCEFIACVKQRTFPFLTRLPSHMAVLSSHQPFCQLCEICSFALVGLYWYQWTTPHSCFPDQLVVLLESGCPCCLRVGRAWKWDPWVLQLYTCVMQGTTASSWALENYGIFRAVQICLCLLGMCWIDLRFWGLGVVSGSQGLLNLRRAPCCWGGLVGLQRVR